MTPYEIGLSGGSFISWFLMLLFGFFGFGLGGVAANRVTAGPTKEWHTAAVFIVWAAFTLLGGGLGWLLFMPD